MKELARAVLWVACAHLLSACQTSSVDWSIGVPKAPDAPQGYELRLPVRLDPGVDASRKVTLEARGPQGISAALSSQNLTAAAPVALTVASKEDQVPGPYTVVLEGTDGEGRRSSAALQIEVVRRVACPPNGFACEDGMTLEFPAVPVAVRRSGSATVTARLVRPDANPRPPASRLNTSAALSLESAPDGVSVQFSPETLGLGDTVELKVMADASAPLGQSVARVRLTGNLQNFVFATLELDVQP